MKQLPYLRQLLAQHFEPAPDLASADHKLTTKQLVDYLRQTFTSEDINTANVFEVMRELDYTLVPYPPLHFVWLIKEV